MVNGRITYSDFTVIKVKYGGLWDYLKVVRNDKEEEGEVENREEGELREDKREGRRRGRREREK